MILLVRFAKCSCIHLMMIMSAIHLDLRNHFKAFDEPENEAGKTAEKQVAKKMDASAHIGGGHGPFEPRQPVDAVLHDKREKNPGQDSSSVEKVERSDWRSTLDPKLAVVRLMLEGVCKNDGSAQILLSVPSPSPHCQSAPDDFFKSCLSNDCKLSHCCCGVNHDQTLRTTETKADLLHRCEDAESTFGPVKKGEWRDEKSVATHVCGMKRQAPRSMSMDNILKDAFSLSWSAQQNWF